MKKIKERVAQAGSALWQIYSDRLKVQRAREHRKIVIMIIVLPFLYFIIEVERISRTALFTYLLIVAFLGFYLFIQHKQKKFQSALFELAIMGIILILYLKGYIRLPSR